MSPHRASGTLILILLEAVLTVISLVQFGSSREIQPNTTWASSQRSCDDISHRTRIISGQLAQQTDFPWMLVVEVDAGPLWEINENIGPMATQCGGSIISHNWCMSAAHCFVIEKYDANSEPDGFMMWTYMMWLTAGGFRDNDHSQWRNIHTQDGLDNYLFIHQKYNTIRNHSNDIALMRVKEPWDFNARVSPISLADIDDFSVGKTIRVSGYGRTCTKCPASTKLLYVNLNLISEYDCIQDWGPFSLTDSMICQKTEKKNICDGDSGSPAVTGRGKSNGPPYVQIGIVSWTHKDCEKEKAGVFTHVAKLRNWINEKMSSSNSEICEDHNDSCVEKAESGKCTKGKVYSKCKYSCACGIGSNPSCKDSNASKCLKWAAKGKCDSKKVYNKCKSSCACVYRELATTQGPTTTEAWPL